MSEGINYAERWMKTGLNAEMTMYDGVVIPKAYYDNIAKLKTRHLREDDIVLCTHPKSGTHWMWEILCMIVAGKAEYAKHWQNYAWLEVRTEAELEELDSPRVLHTHMLPRILPTMLWEKPIKLVYVERNPKDVVVSSYNQQIKQVWQDLTQQRLIYTGTWADFLDLYFHGGVLGTWFEHVNQWHNIKEEYPDCDICYVKYEDLKRNCSNEIHRVAEFLGRPLSYEKCKEIAEACSFEKLKHASEQQKDQTFHIKWNEGEEGYFRKGIVGDWKNYFTVAQSEMFDKLYEEKMKRKYSDNY